MSTGPIDQSAQAQGTNQSNADSEFNDVLRSNPPEVAPERTVAAPPKQLTDSPPTAANASPRPSADAPSTATNIPPKPSAEAPPAAASTVPTTATPSGTPRVISDMDPLPGERPSSAGILAGATPNADGSFLVANTPFSSGSSRLGANWVGDPASGRQVLMFTQNGGSKDGWTGVEVAPERVQYYPPGTTRGQVYDMLRNPESNVAQTTYSMGSATPNRRDDGSDSVNLQNASNPITAQSNRPQPYTAGERIGVASNPGLNVIYQGGRDISVNSQPYTIPANVDLGSRDSVRGWVTRANDSNGFLSAYSGSGNNLATGSISPALSQPGSLTASGADRASPLAAISDPRGSSNTYIGFRTDSAGKPTAQGEVKYNSGSDGHVFVVNNNRYDIPENVALVDGRVNTDSVRRWAASSADSGGFSAAGVPAKQSAASPSSTLLNNVALSNLGLTDPTGRPSFTGAASITNPAYVDSVLYPNGRPGSSPQNATITAADPNTRSLETRYAGQTEAAARVIANEVGQTVPGLAWLGSAATTQLGRAANAVTGGNLPQIENLGRSGEQAAQNWSEKVESFYMKPGVSYDSSGTPRQTIVPNYESNESARITFQIANLATAVYGSGASTAANSARLGNTAQAFNLSDDVAIRAANTGRYYSNLPRPGLSTSASTAAMGGLDDIAAASRTTTPQRLLPAAGQTSSASTGRLANPTQVEVVRIPPEFDSARAPLNRDVAPRVAGSTDTPIRPASTPDAFRVTPDTPIVVQPSKTPPQTNPFDGVELPIKPDATSQFVLQSTNPRTGATTERFVDIRPGSALSDADVRRAAANVRLGNTHTYPTSANNAPLRQAFKDSEVTARVYNLDPNTQFTFGEPAIAGSRTNAYPANAARDPSSYIHSVISPSHSDLPRVPGGGSQATGIVVRAGDQIGLPPAVLVNTPLGTPVSLVDDAGIALTSRTGVRVENPGVAKLYEGLGFRIQPGMIDDPLSTAAGTLPRDQVRYFGTTNGATNKPGFALGDDAAGVQGTFGGQPITPMPPSGTQGTRLYIQPSTTTPGTGTVVTGPGAPRNFDTPIGIDRQLPEIGGTSAPPLSGRDLTRPLTAAEKTDINNAVRSTFSSSSPVYDTGIGPDELTNAVKDTTRIVTEFGLTPKDAAYVARYGTRPDGTSLRPVIPDAPATVTPASSNTSTPSVMPTPAVTTPSPNLFQQSLNFIENAPGAARDWTANQLAGLEFNRNVRLTTLSPADDAAGLNPLRLSGSTDNVGGAPNATRTVTQPGTGLSSNEPIRLGTSQPMNLPKPIGESLIPENPFRSTPTTASANPLMTGDDLPSRMFQWMTKEDRSLATQFANTGRGLNQLLGNAETSAGVRYTIATGQRHPILGAPGSLGVVTDPVANTLGQYGRFMTNTVAPVISYGTATALTLGAATGNLNVTVGPLTDNQTNILNYPYKVDPATGNVSTTSIGGFPPVGVDVRTTPQAPVQGQFTAFYFPPNQRLTKIDPATGAATGERNSIPVVYYGGTGGALTYGQSDRNAPLGTLGVIGTVGLNEQARLGNFATVQLPGATIFNTVLRGSASTGDVNIGVFGTTTESPQITVGSFIDAGDYRFVTRDLNPYRMLPGGYTISTRNGVSVTEKVGPPSSSGMPLLITPNPGSPGSAGRFLKPPEGFFNIPGLPGSQQLPSPTTTPSPTSTPTPSSPTSFTLPNYQGGQVEAAPVSTDTNGQTLYRVTWTGSSGRTESFDMKLTGQIGTDQFAEGTPSSMELKRRINR